MNKWLHINVSLYVGVILVGCLFFLAIFGPQISPHTLTETLETHYEKGEILAPPLDPFQTKEYPLGTDKWGYDLLTMILHGIRHTLFISLAVTFFKMTIGVLIGIYVGVWKKTPSWLESIENSWSYVPLFLILYFFLLPINFGSYAKTSSLIAYFVIITSAISIPSIVSSVRKKTKEVSKSVFIEAAKTLGANKHQIIWKHIFPQMKESLLVMFILEIVYVITIMGQLALMNIFIGGTIVRYDPVIYLSATKEIAGLVGQARGNIYGSVHILVVPLLVLLLTTISFSLLANGLKNRYQSEYQRTPWIKTGFEMKLKPNRKVYMKKNKFWSLSGSKVIIITFSIVLLGVVNYFQTIFAADQGGNFSSKAQGVKNDNSAHYELLLKMNEKGEFQTTANIEVENQSDKNWSELVFYFIPPVFSKGDSIDSLKEFSENTIVDLKVDGKKAMFTIEEDTLTIKPKEGIQKGDQVRVQVTYRFTLPEDGNRFSKRDDQYYLGQWYPMLATFQNGKWNKNDYLAGYNTVHTSFSDYIVHYDIPKGYTFVSTADGEEEKTDRKGTVKAERVRDFFIAIVKDSEVYTTTSNGVEIRLYVRNDSTVNPKEALTVAKNALGFFQEKIGKYPHKQLDIVFDQLTNNEYPGILTMNSADTNFGSLKYELVHQIAHQYFFGVVANNPNTEAWISEGMSEFAANIYFYLGERQGVYRAQALSHSRMFNINDMKVGRQYSNVAIHDIKHPGFVLSQPALQLFSMVQEKHEVRQKDFPTVLTEYLSDYYHHFQYKEVDTSGFIRFTKDYFQVPSGYFNEWLDTSKVKF